jgi:hypothetical protein
MMEDLREERRFARWICRDCHTFRFSPIPSDGRLKCPICYAIERFDPRRHARRDPANRGKAPQDIGVE